MGREGTHENASEGGVEGGRGVERPRRKETGQPWRFPDNVESGVLMSACASTLLKLK